MLFRYLILLLLAALPALAQESPLRRVAWLEGCWEQATTGRRMVERWNAPATGVMHGGSFLMSGSDTRELERLRLFAEGDTLVYEAHPATQALTRFRSASPQEDTLTFENPAHDFPQRITYMRRGTDSLLVRIDGDREGRRGPRTFAFRRAACPVP